MRFLLIRHGRSAHLPAGRMFDRAGIERWYVEYDRAAIMPDDEPPAALVAEVGGARVVVASDLPRAVASAQRVAPNRSIIELPHFREIPLPIPAIAGIRAPIVVWGTLIHTKWMLDIMRGRDVTPDAFEQVRVAAQWCRRACREYSANDTIAIVTHGVFRRLLTKRLLEDGWRLGPGRRSYSHWSVWRVVGDCSDRA